MARRARCRSPGRRRLTRPATDRRSAPRKRALLGQVWGASRVDDERSRPPSPHPDRRRSQRRAREAQAELAKIGHHRMPPIDVILAACAEEAGAGVLHYDRAYDVLGTRTAVERRPRLRAACSSRASGSRRPGVSERRASAGAAGLRGAGLRGAGPSLRSAAQIPAALKHRHSRVSWVGGILTRAVAQREARAPSVRDDPLKEAGLAKARVGAVRRAGGLDRHRGPGYLQAWPAPRGYAASSTCDNS
jgi:hypothetical protein